MLSIDERIKELSILVAMQTGMVNITLGLMQDGKVTLPDGEVTCSLSSSVKKTVGQLVLAAGQFTYAVLDSTEVRGFKVRTLFPTARSIVETLINATYILGCGEEMAEKAIRHAMQKFHRNDDRTVGKGNTSMRIRVTRQADLSANEELRKAVEEFTRNNGRAKDWTDESIPERIERIGQKFQKGVGTGFIGAYALIYADASEIVHGSFYGTQKFLNGGYKEHKNLEDFQAFTAGHLEGILFAIFLSLHDYLNAFFSDQHLNGLRDANQKIFDQFTSLVGQGPAQISDVKASFPAQSS